MNSKTDINKCKEVAKLFVDLEPDFSEVFVVNHPIIDSQYVLLNKELVNLAEGDNLAKYREYLKDYIDSRVKNYLDFILFIKKPYLLAFLRYTEDYLSIEDFSEYLSESWVLVEYSNNDKNYSKSKLLKAFKRADKNILMNEDELESYNKLDDYITVYRGVKPKSSYKALSWTTNKKIAQWFADRFDKNGAVYKAKINKKYIFAYFSRRNEDEIVLDYTKLEDVRKIGGNN